MVILHLNRSDQMFFILITQLPFRCSEPSNTDINSFNIRTDCIRLFKLQRSNTIMWSIDSVSGN
ncbi:hypothetical protein [Candidatus Hodgkinia cicadicola]|uniref:hypothetical protein n=1 Tax=Candidatus Hodgkinia cicadicola TaxID=573658 RepID=UPI001788ADF3